MALVSHVLAMALGAGGAGGNEAEPATVRCRPAPYMVSDVRAAKPAKITLVYGQAQATTYARDGRPCILMRTETGRTPVARPEDNR